MIGRLWLRFTRLAAAESFPRRLLHACLYQASEFESLVICTHYATFMRRAFLRCKGVEFAQPCYISHGFQLWKTRAACLKIGQTSSFGENAGIYVHADILIGENFVAAPGLTINNGTHDVTTMEGRGEPLTIGDRVWCGVNVTILAGARIGDDCVIGANSLVMSEIPTGSLAVGSPARVIRSNIRPKGKAQLPGSQNKPVHNQNER
jgi:acetyltransferase-like isoleucine patch superfamily enzyme